MKKGIFLAAMFAASALFFNSCSGDDENKGAATITAPDSYNIPNDLADLSIPVTVTAPTDAELEAVTVQVVSSTTGGKVTSTLKSVTSFSTKQAFQFYIANTSDGSANIIALNYNATMTEIIVKSQVKDGDETTKTIKLNGGSVDPGDDLAAAVSFSWQRVGGAAGTGLSTYGLKWTSNAKATNAIIVKDNATKLVKLNSSDWTTITTKAALKTAIDAAADLGTNGYRGVSADANGTYNDVLGTIVGDAYYMIHVTNGTVASSGSGTTITITGQSRN